MRRVIMSLHSTSLNSECFCCVFFFSSRRRHTRCSRDWSSDVCSSDLGREVGRDEAARALRISRALAAFHLDKLVQLGLLEAAYRRLSGRQGPGAGRPAKLYRRSTRQLEITLPQRRYALAGRLLARALAAQRSPASRRALERAARDLARTLGQAARSAGRRGRGRRRGGGPGGALPAALAAPADRGCRPPPAR